MEKDEILELHEQMVSLKVAFEAVDSIPDEAFGEYESLNVSPDDIHLSKRQHRHAIFVLGKSFASHIKEDDFGEVASIEDRMEELANEELDA